MASQVECGEDGGSWQARQRTVCLTKRCSLPSREAAYLLQRYLSRPTESTSALQFDPPCALVVQEESTGVRAIELGAGVGLVGIHLACVLREQGRGAETKGDHVVLTDLDNVLPLLERNTERAGLMHGQNETADVSIKSLPWGSTRHADAIMNALSPAGLTHIICSDLVYFPELLPPLLRTLIHLTSDVHRPGPAAEVIISYKIRSLPKEEPFWRAFGAWFDFAPVLCSARNSTANAGQQGWRRFGSRRSDALGRGQETSLDGSDDGQEPAEDEVFIFVAHRRQETRACRAPHSDEKLMDGWLLCQDGTQVQGKGIDTFELILMASLET